MRERGGAGPHSSPSASGIRAGNDVSYAGDRRTARGATEKLTRARGRRSSLPRPGRGPPSTSMLLPGDWAPAAVRTRGVGVGVAPGPC